MRKEISYVCVCSIVNNYRQKETTTRSALFSLKRRFPPNGANHCENRHLELPLFPPLNNIEHIATETGQSRFSRCCILTLQPSGAA
jgi:hypothetical protein